MVRKAAGVFVPNQPLTAETLATMKVGFERQHHLPENGDFEDILEKLRSLTERRRGVLGLWRRETRDGYARR
jgi:hypothetical protein